MTAPSRIWIDAWGGNWSPLSGGTQNVEYIRADAPELLALVHAVKAMRDAMRYNIIKNDEPHTVVLPDGSRHSGPVVDFLHALIDAQISVLDAALPAVQVGVKPLEWKWSTRVQGWRADCELTRDVFIAYQTNEKWSAGSQWFGTTYHQTADAAKTHLDQMRATRIRSALTAQPSPDVAALASLRAEHAEWSQRQFGDVSAIGPAKHLAKEALEVAADPTDAIEHADCWMLLWDMQRRAGITDRQLAEAISTKLAINKAREWPAPREGEAREHDRTQDAALARVKGGAA